MTKNVAIFSGRFNPPGLQHQIQAIVLAEYFDQIIVVPCGPRPDKPLTNDIPSFYRAALVDIAFAQLPRTTVDLFDLEAGTFSKTHQLEAHYHHLGTLWHVVGTRMIADGRQGNSVIQQQWEDGPKLWNELNFAILYDPANPPLDADLPPHHRLIAAPQIDGSSELRQRIYNGQSLTGLIDDNVLAYINRHQLYCGLIPRAQCYLPATFNNPLLVVDEKNSRAREIANRFVCDSSSMPDIIIVIGGDGTMLHAIRQHWRRRLPFYGINTGHLGFLLNDQPLILGNEKILLYEQLPLLHVELNTSEGGISSLAFNDAWVERASGQTAHLEISIDDQVRLPQLIADGALVATAAGSTSYARAMGAMPLPLDSGAQLLVGSNVLVPNFFRPVVLPLSSNIKLKTLDPEKRPLNGFIDGISYGQVTGLTSRLSNSASIELLFDPSCDATEKLARIQFPSR